MLLELISVATDWLTMRIPFGMYSKTIGAIRYFHSVSLEPVRVEYCQYKG